MAYAKYYKYKIEISYDQGETWIDTGERVPSGDPIGTYDTLEECMVMYRTIQSGTTCVGYDKHNQDVYEVSYDNGVTWSVVSTSAGTLIEADSPDCGYVPPQPKYKLTLSDSSTVSAECESTSSTITRAEISMQYGGTVVSAELGNCVTSIDQWAFYRCSGLTSIEIPNSVTSIGGVAFEYCSGLTSVTIPEGVTVINSNTFESCYSLRSVTLPYSIQSIKTAGFDRCTSLRSIALPINLTSIGDYAFQYTSLSAVTIPEGVTSIGEYAFNHCETLANITLLSSTPPTLGSGAFNNTSNCPIYVPCDSLSAYQSAWSTYASRIQCNEPVFGGKYKLTLSDSSIVTAACDSTSSITRSEMSAHSNTCIVQIGDCVTSIDNYACYPLFNYLSSVTIGNNVISIGNYAFTSCSNLTSIDIPNSVTSIGDSAFEYCHSLSSITIGSGLTTIDINAFSYCDSLTNVIFPDSVTTIGNQFLEGCTSLTSVTIGSGITSIGTWFLNYCGNINSVIIKATTPPTLGGAPFRNTNNSFIIYVPSGSVNAFKSASGWSTYADRIQAIP